MENLNKKTEEMEEKIQIHPEIYNNIGILRMKKSRFLIALWAKAIICGFVGLFQEAEEAFKKALSILDDPALKNSHDVKYKVN